MNEDDFEKRLEQQPLRQVPRHWREHILAAARAAGNVPRIAQPNYSGESIGHILSKFVAALLWPSPKAWVGLASIWMAILLTNHAVADKNQASASGAARPGPEALSVRKEQARLLAELMEPQRAPVSSRLPKPPAARPRSEIRNELHNA